MLGLQTMIPSQQPSYQSMMGVQQPQNPGLLNSQRAGMGGQMQSIMVQYPQMPSYQVWSKHSVVEDGSYSMYKTS